MDHMNVTYFFPRAGRNPNLRPFELVIASR